MDQTTKHLIEAGETVTIGPFTIDTMHVGQHPDGIGLGIHTEQGIIVHTGDFKFDPTPVDGRMTDFAGFERLGDQGVLLLITDTTNVERPGYVPSERIVGQTFYDVFRRAERRVIIATFASNIHRIQQAIQVSADFGRKVAILGRSMAANTDMASQLGYLDVPADTRIAVPEIDFLAGNQVTILTTGSQGEPMSALSLMASEEHKKVQIQPGDTVIISATPIPGNEDLVNRTINHLIRLGADVVYHPLAPVHVSGHAYQDEQKMIQPGAPVRARSTASDGTWRDMRAWWNRSGTLPTARQGGPGISWSWRGAPPSPDISMAVRSWWMGLASATSAHRSSRPPAPVAGWHPRRRGHGGTRYRQGDRRRNRLARLRLCRSRSR